VENVLNNLGELKTIMQDIKQSAGFQNQNARYFIFASKLIHADFCSSLCRNRNKYAEFSKTIFRI
jgi:hypothetical protein